MILIPFRISLAITHPCCDGEFIQVDAISELLAAQVAREKNLRSWMEERRWGVHQVEWFVQAVCKNQMCKNTMSQRNHKRHIPTFAYNAQIVVADLSVQPLICIAVNVC